MADVLFCDGHDNAFMGLMWRFGHNAPIAAYSRPAIIKNLMSDGMTYDDAQEFFEFNIIGAWMGEGTPCFIDVLSIDEAKELTKDYSDEEV